MAREQTAAALRSKRDLERFEGVASREELAGSGIGPHEIEAQFAARRWRPCGSAVLLHNADPSMGQRRRAALISCGPRAVLTSFTAAEAWGLRGWEREEIHVLAPSGTKKPDLPGLRLHRIGDWRRAECVSQRSLQRLAPSLVIAASSFPAARPACGLLAAAVQQRLVQPSALAAAVRAAPRTRHRKALRAAVADIAQGSEALSEIDFVRLCRRAGLPEPTLQAVRVEPSGRRRYLDAHWDLPDGRVLAVEVDGAVHLDARRWVDDQLRQNEIVLGGMVVLRFASVVVRLEPELVAAQLRRALGL